MCHMLPCSALEGQQTFHAVFPGAVNNFQTEFTPGHERYLAQY